MGANPEGALQVVNTDGETLHISPSGEVCTADDVNVTGASDHVQVDTD